MRVDSTQTYALQRSGDGTVITMTLRRPRCLDIAGKHELTEAFVALAEDPDLRVVLLAAEHPEALLVDVAELADMTPAAALAYSRAGQRLMAVVEALPAPTIAAVSGPALGGGCELILGFDLALCSVAATFGQIEVNGGVVPAFGGTWRLVRRVGYQRACQMIFTGAILDAPAAEEHGLVLQVVPSEVLLDRCRELAAQICSASRSSVTEAKRILTGSSGRGPEIANAMEQAGFAALFGTADQRERMEAFVAEHGD
jgi:enoyl-CoA hydratase/carnithine racemase